MLGVFELARARRSPAAAPARRRARARRRRRSPCSAGTASSTVTSERRLRTTPIAPSSPCSPTRTTVRWKLGSSRSGAATSSCPRSESTGQFWPNARLHSAALRPTMASCPSRAGRSASSPARRVSRDEDLFELVETEVPDPADGQILIRNAYLSVDPYMRGRMNDRRSYVAPYALGEAMTGGAVGRVAASRNADWPEGSWVLHSLGWREWALSDGGGLQRVDRDARARVDGARRARHARLHRLVRPHGAGAAARGRDGVRLGRCRRRRQRRRAGGPACSAAG